MRVSGAQVHFALGRSWAASRRGDRFDAAFDSRASARRPTGYVGLTKVLILAGRRSRVDHSIAVFVRDCLNGGWGEKERNSERHRDGGRKGQTGNNCLFQHLWTVRRLSLKRQGFFAGVYGPQP